MLDRLFPHPWPLIGVVHLAAMPGSPFARLTFEQVRALASADAQALLSGGMDGVIVENFGDRPFHPEAVEPHTVAAMALIVEDMLGWARSVRPQFPPAVGVNVLRNDARAAIGIAAAAGASFVRVNVHVGSMVTDQGVIQGRAHETMRYRRNLGSEVAMMADVLVKHAVPLGAEDVEGAARDAFHRGGADALIVTGKATGEPADLERVARVRGAVPEAPVLVGSGVTLEALPEIVRAARGAIVGTATKRDGRIDEPVSEERVRALVLARDAAM